MDGMEKNKKTQELKNVLKKGNPIQYTQNRLKYNRSTWNEKQSILFPSTRKKKKQ